MDGQAPIAAERCRTGGQPRHAVDEPAARIRGDQADFGIEGQAPAPEFGGRLEPGEHAVGREPTERAVRLGPQQGVSFLEPPDARTPTCASGGRQASRAPISEVFCRGRPVVLYDVTWFIVANTVVSSPF